MRVYTGRPFALGEHLDRLERSAANLRLGFDVPRTELESDVRALLDRRGPGFEGCLRLVLTRAGRRLALTEPLPPAVGGARLGYVTWAPTRVLDGVKSLSYAANMLATRLARERGFDEALLVTPHGHVLEAPTSSFFWADADGRLFTPPLAEHILASITRDRLLGLVEVRERSCSVEDVEAASEAFLASTTREVQPVVAIEQRALPGDGQRTREAAAAFRRHVDEALS